MRGDLPSINLAISSAGNVPLPRSEISLRSRGGVLSDSAAGPLPPPLMPWQELQYRLNRASPTFAIAWVDSALACKGLKRTLGRNKRDAKVALERHLERQW